MDINPDKNIIHAMNKIIAIKNEADADYIKTVRNAEADRDRKILQGEGIGGQRLQIIKSYSDGIAQFNDHVNIPQDKLMSLILQSQHLDVMESVALSSNTKVLLMDRDANTMVKDMEATFTKVN